MPVYLTVCKKIMGTRCMKQRSNNNGEEMKMEAHDETHTLHILVTLIRDPSSP